MIPSEQGRFATTQWSVVLRAREPSGQGREALSQLYASYWPAVYAYLRRKGRQPTDACDICQEFFVHLVEKGLLERLDRSRGRFRSYLLATLEHFLANRWRIETAAKRGGARPLLSLDVRDGERCWQLASADEASPQAVFDRAWAHEVLARAIQELRRELGHSDQRFEVLMRYLRPVGPRPSYAELAVELELDVTQVARTLHKTRQRLQRQIRKVLSETVTGPDQLDDELRDLFDAC